MRELYQQLIIDHGQHPRNFHSLPQPCRMQVGNNPLCGDRLAVYLKEHDGVIEKISFHGEGCAISMASASLMTERLQGKTKVQVLALFHEFHQMLTEEGQSDHSHLGKLLVLANVKAYPIRVKCATLAWHTMQAALNDQNHEVTTE